MKKIIPILLFIGFKYSHAQNVGIGTTTPVAGLHILHNNGIIAKGDTLSNNPYVLTETGAGAKFIWHPKKGAFMVGRLDNFGDNGNRWDEDSIGFGAMNLGYANKVKGDYSFAAGIGNIISGGSFGSIAMGHNSVADSNETVAIGFGARALQRQAIAIGTNVVANGRSGFATGLFSSANGYVSTAGGYANVAAGDYSFCTGYADSAIGNSSAAFGYFSKTKGENSFAAGQFNFTGGNSAIALGSGNKANGYQSISIGTNNQTGTVGNFVNNSFAFGNADTTFSFNCFVIGNNSKAFYPYSYAIGNGTQTFSNYAFSIGNNNITLRDSAFAIGNNVYAGGQGSVAIGYNTTTSVGADYSLALGRKAVTGGAAPNSTALGAYAQADCANCIVIGSITGVNGASVNANVGIGVTVPAATLDVQKNGGTTTLINFKGTNHYSHFMFGGNEDTYIRGGLNTSNVIIGDLNTAVIIGSAAPLAGDKLTIQGGNLRVGGSIVATGNICAFGTIGACSDIRYKTNFSFIRNPLQKIQQLHAIYYNWKKDEFPQMHFNNERQLGLSAQEVEKLFPEIVQTNADGYKAVDYSRLTPVLVEGIKEQQLQIETLQKENADLKVRLERLEKSVLNK